MPLVSLEEAVEKLIHILPRIQTYTHVAKERCTKPADNLTQDEAYIPWDGSHVINVSMLF